MGEAAGKSISDKDMRRMNWGGLKPLVRDVIALPLINPALVGLARATGGAWKLRLPVARHSAGYRTLDGQEVRLLDPIVDQVARELFWHDGRPGRRGDRLAMRALELLSAEAGVFLDIGSYTGLFALTAARVNPAIRSHAFEIVPDNHLLIQRNIVENDLIGRVQAHLCGLGGAVGSMTMPRSNNLSSLPSSLSLGSTFEGGIRIPVDTLDNRFAGETGPMAIKIDVEGFEGEVLRGGAGVLARLKPDIICEVLRGHGEAVQTALKPLGYRFWRFTDEGLVAAETVEGVKKDRDWFLSARPDAEAFVARIEAD
jgi:FkbM family methyltransferase